ncbi:MAG TPA: M13 family metallopeptidase [Stenomitos sp.]
MVLALSISPSVYAQPAVPFEGVDSTVRPQDDLFRHANGAWLKTAQIPGDRVSYGVFDQMAQGSEDHVRTLLEEARVRPGTNAESRMLGDFYASLLDTASIERSGLKSLKAQFDAIQQLKDTAGVSRVLAQLSIAGVHGPVGGYVGADAKQPTMNVLYVSQDGLGLPNRDYYLSQGTADKALRQDYLAYLTKLGKLSGARHPEADARAVLAFETELAKIQWTEVECRDDLKTYNPTTREQWVKDYGPFDWEAFAKTIGMPAGAGCVVGQPTYFKAFAKLAQKTPVSTWQAYMRLHVLDEYAANLGASYRAAYQHFRREKLRGLTSEPPRWRTALRMTSDMLGEAIGMRYVAKYFPASSKVKARNLVDNLLAAYHKELSAVDWMSDSTRQEALDKLSKITVKIGYPDKWRGYQGLVVKRQDAVGNLVRANRFTFERAMKDVGQPVDKTRWDMTPQTVNAYYNPVGNEIVFPAAILQAPFFDAQADDAFNYGAIGAIIGHEISHGFDDSGRHYDGEGKMRDWWTASDEKAFNERTARLVAEYDTFEPLKGIHVNGKLTLGENIADLAGITTAFNAYHLSLGDKPAAVVGGVSGDQRFFYAYARGWRSKARPQTVKEWLLTDPHSPDEYRTNGIVTNIDGFYDSFGVKPGDKLYKESKDRVRLW